MGSRKVKKSGVVSRVLPDIVDHKGWKMKLDMHSFFPIWHKVVSENVASCSRPLKIVKDTLWLEVSNSSWMQQLQFEKRQILQDINATLKISRIRDIKFILPQDDKGAREKDEKPLSFVSPDPEVLQKFEQQVGVIEDDAIRDSLIRLWYLSKACRREK